MLTRILKPFPGLLAALISVALALLYIDHGWQLPFALLLGTGALLGIVYCVGRLLFPRWPYRAGFIMEIGLALLTMAAGVAGAVLVWLAIEKAPGDKASTRDKQTYAALSAAVTAYLGSVIIKPEGGTAWNPVKLAIKHAFGSRFTSAATDLERDARDAATLEAYGANAPQHHGNIVDGWGWKARRLRTRHIQDAL